MHMETTPKPPPRRLSSCSRATVSFTCAAKGMAEGDRAAVDVHPLLIELKLTDDMQALGSEGFIDLVQRNLIREIPVMRSAFGSPRRGRRP